MNALFMAAMIIESIFALGFISVPGLMLGQFGVVLNETATVFARLFGSAMLSFPVLLWYGRRSDKPEFKKGVVRGLFMYYLVSTPHPAAHPDRRPDEPQGLDHRRPAPGVPGLVRIVRIQKGLNGTNLACGPSPELSGRSLAFRKFPRG